MITPLFSVIIPVRNSAKTLEKCLQSIKNQTYTDFELIVVDDGSLDESRRIAQLYADLVIENKHPGPAGARNTGAKYAAGQILAFTDSDCIVPPTWLEKFKKVFDNTLAAAVGGGYSSGVDHSFWQDFSSSELAHRRRHITREVNTLVSNNLAIKKKIFEEFFGFPEQYPACEDMFLSYQISRKYPLLWLSDNGVIHHFKTSLISFLKHQYFFAAESMRFFLQNPVIKKASNHQGSSLHLSIMMAGLGVFFLFTSVFVSIFFHNYLLWLLFLLSLLMHSILNSDFLRYFIRYTHHSLIKAYLVTLCRDIVACFAGIDGIYRAIITWREKPFKN